MSAPGAPKPATRVGARSLGRLRVWLGRLLAIMLGFVFAFALLEIGFRVVGIGGSQFFEPDSLLGVRPKANMRGPVRGACYKALVSTNSHGWRDKERAWEKPRGVFRVVVLGDSFMEALQVNDDQTFASVLERKLAQRGVAGQVEVLNLSCASWGTDQEYLALKYFGLRYHPDLVIVAFFSQNDVQNNWEKLEREGSTYPKPFFRLENGHLQEVPFRDPTPRLIQALRQFLGTFRVYNWGKEKVVLLPPLHRLLFRLELTEVVPRSRAEGKYPSRWLNQSRVFRKHYNQTWEEAWTLTEALIRKSRDDARSNNANFLLLGVSDPLSVMPLALIRQDLPGVEVESLDFDKPHRRLQEFAERERMDFLSLLPSFRARVENSGEAFDSLYLPCDGHYTPAGHELAAEAVAAHIRARTKAADAGNP